MSPQAKKPAKKRPVRKVNTIKNLMDGFSFVADGLHTLTKNVLQLEKNVQQIVDRGVGSAKKLDNLHEGMDLALQRLGVLEKKEHKYPRRWGWNGCARDYYEVAAPGEKAVFWRNNRQSSERACKGRETESELDSEFSGCKELFDHHDKPQAPAIVKHPIEITQLAEGVNYKTLGDYEVLSITSSGRSVLMSYVDKKGVSKAVKLYVARAGERIQEGAKHLGSSETSLGVRHVFLIPE